jgi:glutaredoxin
VFELVMYSRTTSCPFVTLAKRVLNDYDVPYREIYIDRDDEARRRVLAWTGFLAVPTLVIAQAGGVLPIDEPSYLEKGRSPRGIDRGYVITEPNIDEFTVWLTKHGLIAEPARD